MAGGRATMPLFAGHIGCGVSDLGLTRCGGLRVARDQLDDQAGRGYANLYQAAVDRTRLAEYAWCYTDGLAFCFENDTGTG